MKDDGPRMASSQIFNRLKMKRKLDKDTFSTITIFRNTLIQNTLASNISSY